MALNGQSPLRRSKFEQSASHTSRSPYNVNVIHWF